MGKSKTKKTGAGSDRNASFRFSDPPAGGAANAQLRRDAEDQLEADPPSPGGPAEPEMFSRALQELRINQIELEMQNEELRRAQVELDVARARYFDLYDLAPIGYCTLSALGLILQTNLSAVTMLGLSRARRDPEGLFAVHRPG